MKDKSWHFYLPAMILLLILWYVISIIVHLPIIPSPVLVMERLGNIFTQTIAIHALYSLWRIIAGVFLAIIIGTLLVVNNVLLLSSYKDVSKQQTRSSKVASERSELGHRSEQEIVHQKRFGIGLDVV